MIVTIIIVAVLIMSAVVHEYAHGVAALAQGDRTAQDAGRLTLNPIKHLDLFGSIIVPAVLIITKVPIFFAWAKPVPINPYNFKDVKYGEFKVAAAGPLSNFILAIFFAIVGKLLPIVMSIKYALINGFFGADTSIGLSLLNGSMLNGVYVLSLFFVMVNLALGLFNLLPWPPLDGSRLIFPWLPVRAQNWFMRMEHSPYSFVVLILLLSVGILEPLFTLIPMIFGWLVL